jgi:hypothetical protein
MITVAQRREYDAFGPWVQEVASEEDLPPRFLPWWGQVRDAEFRFKIPFDVERRMTTPGADLYRALLAVDGQGLSLLTLAGSELRWQEFPMSRLRALVVTHVLLKGLLEFLWDDGTKTPVEFNAVSLPLIQRLVDFLRPVAEPGRWDDSLPSPLVGDYYQQNLVRDQRRRRDGRVVVCDEPTRQKQGVLVFDTGSELVVIDSGFDKRTKSSAYATRTTFVRREHLASVSAAPVLKARGQADAWLDVGPRLRFRLGDVALRQFLSLSGASA